MASTQQTQHRKNQSSVQMLKDRAYDLRDDVTDIARLAKDAARETVMDVQETANSKMKDAESYVTDRPYVTIAAAVGLGFVLGLYCRK